MQATIAAHLPSLPAASDVYASDWTRDRPLPDARADEGTDWEAHYELGSGESFMVVMGYVKPSDRAGDACAPPQGDPAAPSCEVDPGRDGSTTTTTAYQNLSNGLYYFQTTFMSDDGGWVVSTFDKVRAESWTDAFAGRSVDQASAVDLVNDHLMKFTAPASWPS
jgi:hypothetical protein